MKSRFFPLLLIASLFTIVIFGFFGLSAADHLGQHNCPIALLSGSDCPPADNSFAIAFHHISGLQNFTQSIINFDSSALLLSILLIAIFLIFSKFSHNKPQLQHKFRSQRNQSSESLFIPKRQFLRWLALHYKRDPHALQWVHDTT